MNEIKKEKYSTDLRRRQQYNGYKTNLSKGRINLPLFSTVVPAIIFVFLSCRHFVAITTLSTLTYTGNESTRLARILRKIDKNIKIAYKTNKLNNNLK